MEAYRKGEGFEKAPEKASGEWKLTEKMKGLRKLLKKTAWSGKLKEKVKGEEENPGNAKGGSIKIL